MPDAPKLISANEAAKAGIEKVRKPSWIDPNNYVKIDIVDGELGPWFHLYSDGNIPLGVRNPHSMLWAVMQDDPDEKCFVPYVPSDQAL